MKKAYQITAQGRTELEKELAELKGRRSEIADKISEARDYGDLSENAEYDSAREEQGVVETRIAEIEDILMNAEEITSKRGGKVQLGSKVELKNGKTVTYTIVGPVEADPISGKISNESPIGLALMGKKEGERVMISTPRGDMTYKVLSIS
jgi:transcription elongation factor GreA